MFETSTGMKIAVDSQKHIILIKLFLPPGSNETFCCTRHWIAKRWPLQDRCPIFTIWQEEVASVVLIHQSPKYCSSQKNCPKSMISYRFETTIYSSTLDKSVATIFFKISRLEDLTILLPHSPRDNTPEGLHIKITTILDHKMMITNISAMGWYKNIDCAKNNSIRIV